MEGRIDESEIVRQRFGFLRDKKILVYGSGKTAVSLINMLQGFNIVGVIDRILFEGTVGGVPIIIWDDVCRNMADVVIIASLQKNYREIYLRIRHYCALYNLEVYNYKGRHLTGLEYYGQYTYEELRWIGNSEQDLMDKIDEYDAVSFDLFDTLVMRRVLEPTDLFDAVERNVRKKGIHIENFKKKRRTAELDAKGADIYTIYEELKKKVPLSDWEAEMLMEEELSCEKRNILPRYSMIDVMEYAIKKGKTVSIISNMYLTSGMVKEILDGIGIKGYQNLYISCEYKTGKSGKLFEIYRSDIGDIRCLHIGDDSVEDIISAQKNNISAYKIESGLELLKKSRMETLLRHAVGFANRLLIGFFVSEVFNNPFCLCGTGNCVTVSCLRTFGRAFIAPVVLIYIQNLMRRIERGEYDGVIFPTRDGYFFHKVYEKKCAANPMLPLGIYLKISRRLAIALSQADSEEGRAVYRTYMQSIGINLSKKYLFCELSSSGTAHRALNKIFGKNLDGFYLSTLENIDAVKKMVTAVYDAVRENNLYERVDLLEAVLTSPQPAVKGLDGNGKFLYEAEVRSPEELETLEALHEDIKDFLEELERICADMGEVTPDLPEQMIGLIDGALLRGEMEAFAAIETVDPLTGNRFPIMRKR